MKNKNFVKALFTHQNAMMLLINPESANIVEANPAACNFFGYTYSELCGLPYDKLSCLPPEMLKEKLQTGKDEPVNNFVSVHKLKNGTIRNIETNSTPMKFKGEMMVFAILQDVSRDDSIRELLMESEEQFKLVWENSTDAMRLTSAEGEIIRVNQAFCNLVNMPKSALEGKSMNISYLDDIKEHVLLGHNKLFSQIGANEYYEANVALWNGTSKWFGISRTLLVLSNKKMLLLSVMRDISDKIYARELFKNQRDLFLKVNTTNNLEDALNLILESVLQIKDFDSGGIYLVDDKTSCLDVVVHKGLSDNFIANVSHYEPDSENLKLVLNCLPVYSKVSDLSLGDTNKAIDSEGIKLLAIIPITYNDKAIAAINIASKSVNEISAETKYSVESIAAQIGGIIARLKSEKALAESQTNLISVFNAIDDLLLVINLKGIILYANPAAKSQLGYDTKELQNLSILQLIPDSFKDNEKEVFEGLLKADKLYNPISLISKTGDFIPMDTHLTRGKWGAEEVFFGISRNISYRIKAEKEIKDINKMLVESNASKDKLFSIIGHDLRSPLSGIMGVSEEMVNDLNTYNKEEITESFELILQTSKKMYSLLNNLLDWAKLQTGRMEYKPVEIYIYFEVNDVIDLMSSLITGKSIKVLNNIPDDFRALGDLAINAAVLRNLISNAIKFTHNEGKIEISAAQIGNLYEISVSDNGTGITEEKLSNLFVVRRGSSTLGTEGEAGSGLGLILCKELVIRNGGEIKVKSKVDVGTTFTYTIPIFQK